MVETMIHVPDAEAGNEDLPNDESPYAAGIVFDIGGAEDELPAEGTIRYKVPVGKKNCRDS